MPYLHSPELGISDSSLTWQQSIGGQPGKFTKNVDDINHWFTEIGSWSPTPEEASSARNARIQLESGDIKPPQTGERPLELISRSFDGSPEGGDQFQWSGYWNSRVAAEGIVEWRNDNGADARKGAEAEGVNIMGVVQIDQIPDHWIGEIEDCARLGVVEGDNYHQPDAVQRSGRAKIPVNGQVLPAGREGKEIVLLRWMMQSLEDGPWYSGRCEGNLQYSLLEERRRG